MDRHLPLSGLRVVELGNIIAAPFAALVLADLGADVVKVERPGTGDAIRASGESGTAIFETLNRNKRSVALDLQSDAGREAYLDLAGEADVVVENLGAGVADRLGVGYDALRERNPGLVYLSIKGFLQGGPYSDRPGMDVVAEAMSGLMRMTGERGRRPVRAGTSVADIGAGMYGLVGVALALRERDRTGEGDRVEVGLFESSAQWMAYWATYAQQTGADHPPLGSSHPAFGLYDVFRTDGGWLFVGVVTPRHWPAFCRATGLESLATDERFDTPAKRLERKGTLRDVVADELADRGREALVEALLAEGVPAAPVNAPSDLVDDPHLDAVDLLTTFESPHDGATVRTPLTPLDSERFDVAQRRRPPAVGQHTEAVLGALGLDAAAIDDLRERGAFGE